MYEHIWNGKELVQRFTGQVTGDQITESVNAILGDYRFDEIRSLIGDYSQCDGFSIQPQLLEEISATLGAAAITNPQITIAIVTERPEIVAAAWAYLASGLAVYPLRIFPAIDTARVWLAARRADADGACAGVGRTTQSA